MGDFLRILGVILIAAATLWPVYWFAGLAGQHDAGALFSQYLGSASLILMGINQFLATRIKGLETLFGSLDRIYVLHKWIAVIAIAALGLHDIIDAEMDGIRGGALSGIAEDLGEVSLYGLLILGFASVITFIPYHLWKWTHRFIGVFFAMGAFHFFFIEKPFQNAEPLGLYVSAFCLLGLASYLYMILLRPMLPLGHAYVVKAIRHVGTVTEITLTPKGRGMRHNAGQFAFLQLAQPGLGEEHPFTLSSAPAEDGSLRFSIKDLGDFTRRLGQNLEEGGNATVAGPFGHFTLPSGRDPQVWIGAGIGVTPFIAFAESLKTRESGPVTLYYCVREESDAFFAEEFRQLAADVPAFELVLLSSANGERLTPDIIAAKAAADLGRTHVYFCGPKAMRSALRTELISKGLRGSRFHFEEFEMRSGIGLRKLANWLLDRGLSELARRREQRTQPGE
ncbi:ferredoxin reductase family protein [uncultured Roseibium sp.]|uniref:ferredoxin reductase family protein n=1 Tax=uncultured Roseibium sp. TaxID=1936171 RepID=UPI002595EECD|nr:ferredoxin reductase family protein [uncultured Roseibium sp.]